MSIAGSGHQGLEMYQEQQPDLLLLDVMLPGFSGIELLRRIRAGDPDTPVVLLTAKSSVEDKVSGLDLGANDYITKPFQIEELLARVRAALRLASGRRREEAVNLLMAEDLEPERNYTGGEACRPEHRADSPGVRPAGLPAEE